MDSYWKQQTVLITGGSGGLGAEMAGRFSDLGAAVAVNFLSRRERAEELLRKLNNPKIQIYQADVSREDEVDQMVTKIESDFGPVSILVNNAGVIINTLMLTMSVEQWQRVIGTHLTGTFLCSRRVLKEMMKRKHGRIINISSISANRGSRGQTAYSAAKSGVIGLTRSLAHEVGTKGITCNAVVLGLIATEGAMKNVSPELYKLRADSSPLRRIGLPKEVVSSIEFLAGAGSALMSGEELHIG